MTIGEGEKGKRKLEEGDANKEVNDAFKRTKKLEDLLKEVFEVNQALQDDLTKMRNEEGRRQDENVYENLSIENEQLAVKGLVRLIDELRTENFQLRKRINSLEVRSAESKKSHEACNIAEEENEKVGFHVTAEELYMHLEDVGVSVPDMHVRNVQEMMSMLQQFMKRDRASEQTLINSLRFSLENNWSILYEHISLHYESIEVSENDTVEDMIEKVEDYLQGGYARISL